MAGEVQSTVYGDFAGDYKFDRLVDLCEPGDGVQTGPFGSQLHQEDYVPAGTPIITVEHLGENRILHSDIPCVSDSDRQRLSKYALRKGDIVFSRVGSVDRRALVRGEEDGWLFSGRCLRVRPNQARVDPGYLSYFFGLPAFKEHIRAIAVGATMPSLNTQLLSEVVIYYPKLPEQRAIARILGTLDDKIELNRRMNETLEAMARAIFKSWFIDFDPVRAKAEGRQPPGMDATTAALFPDSFEDSPLGKIPKGWKVLTVGDVCEFAYGKALKETLRRQGPIPVYGSNGQVGWHDEALVKGPGIVIGRKGNPGVVTWVPTDFFPIDTTFYAVPKNAIRSTHYLFHALSLLDLPSLGADSAVPGLNRNMAYMTEFPVPPAEIMDVFDKRSSVFSARVRANDEESRTLAAMRDTLLPKLISGELRVQQAEETAGTIT